METAERNYVDVDFPVNADGSLIIADKYTPMRLLWHATRPSCISPHYLAVIVF